MKPPTKPHNAAAFRAHVVLAPGSLGHQIPDGAGDQQQIEEAIATARRLGETREIAIRDRHGDIVGHSHP